MTKQPRRKWSTEDRDVIARMYPDVPARTIASVLKCSITSIYQQAFKLGLCKSDDFRKSNQSGRLQPGSQIGINGRFKPGLVPWNTGTKGVCGLHPNSRRTQFKRGSMSGAAQHNYVPIGTERIAKDGYRERKVTDDHPVPARRWVGVHRLLWEETHGPVPKGHVVVFKNGDMTDIRNDNLELITRRELMARNTVHNLPAPLPQLIQLRGALNRKIHRLERPHEKQD